MEPVPPEVSLSSSSCLFESAFARSFADSSFCTLSASIKASTPDIRSHAPFTFEKTSKALENSGLFTDSPLNPEIEFRSYTQDETEEHKTMKPSPDTPTILIDSRELRPLVFPNLPSERATLTTADYSAKGLEEILLVERKSIPDLIGSLFGKSRPRFERELQRMLSVTSRHLIVIGDNERLSPQELIRRHDYRSATLPHVVLASVSAIQAKGIQVHWLQTPQEAAKCVESLVWYSWRSALKRAGITPPPTPKAILRQEEVITIP